MSPATRHRCLYNCVLLGLGNIARVEGGGSDPDWLDDRMMEQFLSTVSLQWDIYYKHWDLDNILTIDNNIYLCL